MEMLSVSANNSRGCAADTAAHFNKCLIDNLLAVGGTPWSSHLPEGEKTRKVRDFGKAKQVKNLCHCRHRIYEIPLRLEQPPLMQVLECALLIAAITGMFNGYIRRTAHPPNDEVFRQPQSDGTCERSRKPQKSTP